MKLGSAFFPLIAGMLLLILGCETPPELPSVPIIGFESINFKEGDKADSLILSITFEDNEGDLGVNDFNEPIEIFPKHANGDYVTLGSIDTLPAYNICDYRINPTINGEKINDTVYVQMDNSYNNIFLKFYIKTRGTFQPYDFKQINNCIGFDSQFLRLNTQPQDRPLQGSLRYGIQSRYFGTVFRMTDTLQIDVQIRDNAYNYSNIVTTPEFTLESIKAN